MNKHREKIEQGKEGTVEKSRKEYRKKQKKQITTDFEILD